MDKITPTQSFSLSCIRIIATILILSCHLLQGYENQWAFLLNVGVQIFFLLSGFLYGKKEIVNIKLFYKSRVIKVYLPYVIFFIIISIIYFLFKHKITFIQIIGYILNIQAFIKPVEGLNHLWFLSVLMICYLITPFILRALKKPYVFFVIGFILFTIQFVWIQKMYSMSLWIMIYIIGICMGKYESKLLKNCLFFVSLIALSVLLYNFSFNKLIDSGFSHYNGWLHIMLAIFLFLILYWLFDSVLLMKKLNKISKQLDSYSYEVYLTHHVFMLGPLSILYITKYDSVNIFLIILATILSAIILKFITSHIIKSLKL